MEKSNDESLEWTLIKRSLTEELTTEERLQLETWLNESSAHRRYYDRIVGFDPSEGVSGLSGEQCEEELAQYVTLIRKGCVICSVDRGDLFLVSRKRCVGNISENDGVGCKGKGPTDFGDGGRNTH